MISSVFRQPTLKRVPLVRYSARTKRENKIRVQLLRDFPQYGQKGEIIEVLPGLMRNRLYPNNGAAYINPELGLEPKIPVVKKDLRQQQLFQQQAAQAAPARTVPEAEEAKKKTEQKKINPVDLQGLLFDIPTESKTSGTISPSSGSYSMITLNVTLSTLHFSLQKYNPITKSTVSKSIAASVGFNVPASDLTLKTSKSEEVEEITAQGSYTVTIKSEGSTSTVVKKIEVAA